MVRVTASAAKRGAPFVNGAKNLGFMAFSGRALGSGRATQQSRRPDAKCVNMLNARRSPWRWGQSREDADTVAEELCACDDLANCQQLWSSR